MLRLVTRSSTLGHRYLAWEPIEPAMPRIPDPLLEAVVYLYRSVAAADAGEEAGGSGFLVSVKTAAEHPNVPDTVYAVTNRHVIQEGFPVVRLNTRAETTDSFALDENDWFKAKDQIDDVAVCPIGISQQLHRVRTLDWDAWLLTDALIRQHNIGPGDATFFLGRFMNREGRQRNLPSARFGNIALMPDDEVPLFSIEARSLSGYSGSPVFVYIPPWSERFQQPGAISSLTARYLLGIDCGHDADLKPVLDENDVPLKTRWYVEQNSGMMNVLPAWRIDALINREDQLTKRREAAEAWIEVNSTKRRTVKDAASPSDSEVDLTRADFYGALRKIKKEPKGSA